tara:strand:+ start:227 stop:901 length:675 start_codon:yes stop_codon:yes gene_type:complete
MKNIRNIVVPISLGLLLCFSVACQSTDENTTTEAEIEQEGTSEDTTTEAEIEQERKGPYEMNISTNKSYSATFTIENKGKIEIELFAKEAPITVNNFVNLARDGYYDGTTFHRVIPGFMAQGGDPSGTGSGGPGWTIPDEIENRTNQTHTKGALSMANAGPNTGGSQFFITFEPQPHLDGAHTVFGKVTDDEQSMDVVLSLATRDPSTAVEPGDKLVSVTITES